MNNILIFIAAACIAGVWCAGFYHLPIITIYCFLTGLLIYLIWCLAQRKNNYFWPVIILFFFIGMARFLHSDAVSPLDISRHIDKTMVISGVVSDISYMTRTDETTTINRYVLTVDKAKMFGNNLKIPVDGALALTVLNKEPGILLTYGDWLEVAGKVTALHGYNNPGMIDTVSALKRQGISARMSVKSSQIKVLKHDESFSGKALIASIRGVFAAKILKAMPEADAAILSGMLFGGYDGIKKSVLEDFAATGLIHILSVSGSHISLVAGFIVATGNMLGLGRKVTYPAAVLIILLYSMLSGLTSPVIRSAMMGIIALAAVGLGRQKQSAAALALAALIMVCYQPALIYDISFQLSFSSTAGLIFLYPATVKYFSFIPRFLAIPFSVTLAAQLGTLPFIAWYFNSISLSSVLANLIILPPVEVVIILGLIGCVTAVLSPLIGNFLLVLASLLIGMVAKLTSLLAALPGSKVYLPPFSVIGIAGYYGLLLWLYGYFPPKILPLSKQPAKRSLVFYVLIAVIIAITYSAGSQPGYVQVHFIDVGQGDAALITTPNRRAILIDTGGSFNNSSGFDVGERVVVPYLRHYGILGLDYLILTHGHLDHAGGAAAIAAAIPVRAVLLPREPRSLAVNNLLKQSDIRVIPTYDTQVIHLDGIQISAEYAPTLGFFSSGNEISSVYRVSFGNHSFLFTGDMDNRGEQEMLARGIKPCNVLKVGHHGARTSSSQNFIEAVSPQFAVISVGYNNRFGHPHPETLKRLSELRATIYRTDQHGAIVFKSDGVNMTVDSFIRLPQ